MMNNRLENFVSYLSKPTLIPLINEIYSALELQESYNAEALDETDLRARLIMCLLDRNNLKKLLSSLSAYEQEALEHFIFQVGEDMITYRQIEQGLNGIKPNIFRLGLTALRRKGMVYTIRRQWGEVAYIIPSDLQEECYKLMMTDFFSDDSAKHDGNITKVGEVTSESPAIVPFYNDIFLILDQIRAESNQQVPLTQKGTVHKRYIRYWENILEDREKYLEDMTIRYEHKDSYSKQLVILLDFLTRKGLITWYSDRLQLNEAETVKWMGLSRQDMVDSFINYWNKYFLNPTPWIRRYQKDMCFEKNKQWAYLLSPIERWEDKYQLPSISQIQSTLKKEILAPLVAFGLIKYGQTQQGEMVWCWKEHQEISTDIWLQPDMELFCPAYLPFSKLWELTKLFKLKAWENMLIFSLDKTRAMNTIDRGESLNDCAGWLQSLTKVPLPDSLNIQIEQWRKQKQQVSLKDVTVIDIKDEQLANTIAQWDDLKHIDFERITPSLFLVEHKFKEEVCQVLSKKGIIIKDSQKSNVNTAESDLITPSLLATPSDQEVNYKVESIFPDLSEAIPVWQTLPDLWKKQFTNYHERTKRHILETAIEHELWLRVEISTGQMEKLKPIRCQIEHGKWACYDHRHNRFDLEDFNKLQLLFPE